MSKLIIALLASASGLVGLAATTSTAQAQDYYYDDSFADFYVGDRVHVYADGYWRNAVVLELGAKSVLVRYNDFGRVEWVDYSRVSLSGVTLGAAYAPAIRIYYGDTWYDGTLLARRGNRVQVRYRGVTEWVGPDRWHHRHHRHAYQHRQRHAVKYRNVDRRPEHRDRWDRRDRRDRDGDGRRDRDRGRWRNRR